MENPATWTPLHHLIDKVIRKHEEEMEAGMIGLSLPAKIYNALVA